MSCSGELSTGSDCRGRTEHPAGRHREVWGLLLGLVGVFSFGLTLPVTRLAVGHLDPFFVAIGRASVAALLAGLVLLLRRVPVPSSHDLKGLLVVAAGVVFGFPLLSTWAMRHVPASHGGIILALLPMATAVAASVRAGEKPSGRFWMACAAGTAVVVLFTLWGSSFQGLGLPDLALLGAVAAAAVSYAEGGRLARTLGGWQVICWALVLSLPLLLLPFLLLVFRLPEQVPVQSWLGFGYVSLVSQFLGFFAWYEGLAIGGVARVGQVQLLQPFVTVLASALMLRERVTLSTWLAAILVVGTVALAQKSRVRRSAGESEICETGDPRPT